MSNKLIVNNISYHESSYSENGQICLVTNGVKFEVDPFTSTLLVALPVINSKPNDFIFKDINIHVMEKKIFNDYRPLNTISNVIVNKLNRVEPNIHDIKYSNNIIKNKALCEINVVTKQDSFEIFKPIYASVSNSKFVFEELDDLYDIMFVHDNTTDIKNVEMKQNRLLVIYQADPIINDTIVENYFCANVTNRKEIELNFDLEDTIVMENKDISGELDAQSSQMIETNVVDITRGDVSDSGDNGTSNKPNTDLRSLYLIIQLMSFFEFKLSFKNKIIEEVFNLPPGLVFDVDRQKVIGTPTKSGKYTFAILFDDKTILNNFIEVPKLNREL